MSDTPENLEEVRHRTFTKHWLESQHALGGFVRLQIYNHSDANDIIQEVAAQASIHFDKYDPERPFTAWLFGIARQRIAEWYRQQNRTPVMFSSEVLDLVMPALTQMQDRSSDRMEALRHCLSKLNEKQLRLIDLRYSHQLTSEHIAAEVGSTPSSINVMLFRIRDALRRCVEHRLAADA